MPPGWLSFRSSSEGQTAIVSFVRPASMRTRTEEEESFWERATKSGMELWREAGRPGKLVGKRRETYGGKDGESYSILSSRG